MRKIKFLLIFLSFISLSACEIAAVLLLNQMSITQVTVKKDKIYLMSTLNSKSYAAVTEAIEKNPQVKTLVLTANDGSIDDETTFKLARYIRQKKLNTHLINRSVIASGAVDLFLAGNKRTIEKGAKLGVHSWSDGTKQAKDIPKNNKAHRLNADYIKDMLGSEDFYWFTIYAAPADSVYWLTEDEIKKYKLITNSTFLPASNDPTPFGDDFLTLRKEILAN